MMWVYAIGAGAIGHYAFGLTGTAAAVFMILGALSYVAGQANERHRELIAAVKLAGETQGTEAGR